MSDIYATTIRIVVSAESPEAAVRLFYAIGDGPATLVGNNDHPVPLAWVNVETLSAEDFIDATDGNDMFDPIAAFNRLLDTLDAARVDTDEPDGVQRYQDAREACFAFVDAHPEALPLAREYGLPISPGELPKN